MDTSDDIWNRRYRAKIDGHTSVHGDPAWIEPWLASVPVGSGQPSALDIGCGDGANSAFLALRGFNVTAVDIADAALELTHQACPEAKVMRVDVREGLPFEPESFDLLLADLSLHYFDRETTARVIGALSHLLTPNGLFLGHFNSVQDTNFGAQEGEPVGGDMKLRMVDGLQKRFFSRECFPEFFLSPPWQVLSVSEARTSKYGKEKRCWEVAATRHIIP